MPFKRSITPCTPQSDGASSGSSSGARRKSKHPRSSSPWNTPAHSKDLPPIKICILSAKFDSDAFHNLVGLAEGRLLRDDQSSASSVNARSVEVAANIQEADVIVTAIRTRPRLERHVSWSLATSKAVVTPEWLQDSIESGFLRPYSDYIALRDLHDEGVARRPSNDREGALRGLAPSHFSDPEDAVDPRDLAVLDHTSRYSCQRASPLICTNQALVRELDIIRRCRKLEGEERSMLSYARAIAVTYPHPITRKNVRGDVAKLPYLGEKILSMIEEYSGTGKITEAQTILSSDRFGTLSTFTTIHGIGPHTARKLYSLGLRTVEELERYYEVIPGIAAEDTWSHFEAGTTRSEEATEEITIKVALALRHDLTQTIPREEVEEIHSTVMRELAVIEEGCESLVVGGYRRGKPNSNDVDIVITHTDWRLGSEKVKTIGKRVVQHLLKQKLVTHVIHLSGFHEHNALRTHHWDSLQKALAVFSLPQESGQRGISRRVDLIFAAPEVFWTAVVGWTGSTTFERDLRLWAKQQKGMKFDSSGISRRRDSELFFPRSEKEVFETLGLTYVHPTLRNVDA
ncbi:hypothetical protein SCLCIDRAFT_116236 [Scleroderma citrinum Foug A]|uniref:DNA polymerase n=1 Tax=Scleroderma citrinum Foug A TaxID=1036808 RepID=A0A0C3E7J0_9AGAM|nr:hypothetical protein SCLCIDRAFT_116236 [Scleroderma citrinum Foug A]